MRALTVALNAALFAALGLTIVPAQAKPPAPSLAAFFSKPAIGDVALSPSGDTLAMTVPGPRGRMELAIADLNRQPLKLKIAGPLPDCDIGVVDWVNDSVGRVEE